MLGATRSAVAQWETERNTIPDSIQDAARQLAERFAEEHDTIRVRSTPGQLRILVEILFDCTRPTEMRETAYQELLRVLGLF